MFFFLAFLLVLPVWMRGGTRLEQMGPVFWLALAALLGMLFRPPRKEAESLSAARMRVWHRFLSDPVVYLALGFLLILVLQWWNGPREPFFDVTLWRWSFAPPPRPDLPLFCIDRREALEMLAWFAPFFVILLVLRNGFDREGRLDLLKLMAANAAAAALFGVVQFATSGGRIYWLTAQKAHFFAAFGYQNHAGAFFVLAAFLTAGLLLRGLLKKEWQEEAAWLVPCLLVSLAGAVLSKSRAAILATAFLATGGAVYGFLRVRGRHGRPGSAAALVSLAAFLAVAVYVFAVVPGNPVREELKDTRLAEVKARMDLANDPLRKAALAIWGEHRLFGVGGWGFRHYLPLHVPLTNSREYMPGQANVHNDPLQFLAEFGAAGAGLLLVTVLVLLAPVAKAIGAIGPPDAADPRPRFLRIPPLGVALLAGAAVTFLHSFWDLPFRSPAILWLWGAMLACAPDFCERSGPHRRRQHRRKTPEALPPEAEEAEEGEEGERESE